MTETCEMKYYTLPDLVVGSPPMWPKDISSELWREYDFDGRVYRIDLPKTLYVGTSTHRVVDITGLVHCVPAVGYRGCVLRWENKDSSNPVNF